MFDDYTVSIYQQHGHKDQAVLLLPAGEDPPLSIICPSDHRRWWREDTQPLPAWQANALRSLDLPPPNPGATTTEA